MKALSLSRPWTELVLDGHKPIENRTWPTRHRGPIVIHGALSWDGPHAVETAWPILGDEPTAPLIERTRDNTPTGYLGVVDLTYVCTRRLDGRKCSCGPWAFPFTAHWWISNPRRFPEPIPGNGRLGLFVPPDEVLEAVRLLEAAA